MNHENLQRTIVNYLRNQNAWNRAISLDIEADLKTLDEPSKPMLSISISNRVEGNIKTTNLIVNQESLEEEAKLIEQLGEICQDVKPLLVIGYNICRFDQLILGLKMRQLDLRPRKEQHYSPAYWAIRETLGRSYFLDLIDPVRFELGRVDNVSPKMVSLEDAVKHKRFSHLKFIGSKKIVSDLQSSKGLDKWQAIRYLWQNDRPSFEKYISGDSHDTLLLAEDLFGFNSPNPV